MPVKKKYKMTTQRRVILEELKKVKTHPCADELFEIVRKRLPRISLGTVYRNLEMLSELGEIQKLEQSGMMKRFDGTTENHYHIRCTCCGRIEDAPIPALKRIEKKVKAQTDYKITGHRLDFLGICPECKDPAEKGASKSRK